MGTEVRSEHASREIGPMENAPWDPMNSRRTDRSAPPLLKTAFAADARLYGRCPRTNRLRATTTPKPASNSIIADGSGTEATAR